LGRCGLQQINDLNEDGHNAGHLAAEALRTGMLPSHLAVSVFETIEKDALCRRGRFF
jgi:hypothetical protein